MNADFKRSALTTDQTLLSRVKRSWHKVRLWLPAALTAAVLCLLSASVRAEELGPTIAVRQRLVVSDSEPASRVGLAVLQQGGNAVDAAVATALAMAVTFPEAGNLGGGGFMLIYPGDAREPVCIDYRETAPAAATAEMFSLNDSKYGHKLRQHLHAGIQLWLARGGARRRLPAE